MSVPVCPYQVIYLLCVIPRMDICYWTVDMSIIYLVSLVILLFTVVFPLQENFLWQLTFLHKRKSSANSYKSCLITIHHFVICQFGLFGF